MIVIVLFFFFSSRRRHTRFDCDWSSDVCSSDLVPTETPSRKAGGGGTWGRTRSSGRSSWPRWAPAAPAPTRSEEHTSELQSQSNLVCRLLLEKKKNFHYNISHMYSPNISTQANIFKLRA